MGAPQTLPATFDQWDKTGPPASLPADFNQWDQPKPASAASRLGSNLLSGLGVTDDEGAKNFFAHPLDTVIKSFEAQGELAKKARDAYDKGDYEGALQHSLNYLVPFVGQQTDQAGEQLKEGDIAGGIGRTLGAALPIIAGSPEARTVASTAASTVAEKGAAAIRATARGVNKGLEVAPGTIGATLGATIGGKVAGAPGAEIGGIAGGIAGREILPKVRIPGEGFGFPSRVTGGPATIPPEPAAVPGAAGSMAESVMQPVNPPTGGGPTPAPVDPLLERLRAFAANLPPDDGELPPTKSLTPKLKTMLRTVNKIKQTAAPETPVVPPDDADLTSLLQQSLRRVRSLKELQ